MATSDLPIDQLESLRHKANQIIESVSALQRMIEGSYQNYIPPWPDILSKYHVILSQTQNFSNALVSPLQAGQRDPTLDHKPPPNPFEGLALHPRKPMTDMQLDNEVIPLLRNQQTTDVLKMESDTVRRLAGHLATRGTLGVLGIVQPPPSALGVTSKKPEYEDVLQECAQIREAHDQRVERAVRAVAMLRDKFETKTRMEVDEEEPEELAYDPLQAADDSADEDDEEEAGASAALAEAT
ncbi:hypothetical protein MIND_00609000 [Mycena indigotica]|uniref:Mediator of RNA polymerase II transcription subunit 8 n=1 Tax=Mycena indigotica TaxID=2126181 RepID=A0A8H6SQ67_9AGAR|nr:uncharacterized protein MIND_00609000 [Mycena indigotica]KAF7303793.1 hypothetical protein MIND_00609000 [Mycena indigotica]